MSQKKISLAFDIGHSSIGWAILDKVNSTPNILGCGAVIFRPDDCLASARRGFRRQRRHVASTRNRIARIMTLLSHLKVLTEEQLNSNHCSWPWLLAARVLASNGQQLLTWEELWSVLRWYAHNRGYDGNRLWAKNASSEDSEKVDNAKTLMDNEVTSSMAETVCAVLRLDPLKDIKAAGVYFKGENAAFPRDIVENEVETILKAHIGKLPQCDEALIKCLMENWQAKSCSGIKLPKRFRGGLLFGQYVPRFDNRIITSCRISGEKTPLKHCREFYQFRWAMLMANFRVDDNLTGNRPLSAKERNELNGKMEEEGYFTKTTLKKAQKEITGCDAGNLDNFFLTTEMEDALVLDPVKKLLHSEKLKKIWSVIPEKFQKVFASQLSKNKPSSLSVWRKRLETSGVDLSEFDVSVQEQFEKVRKRHKSKTKAPPTKEGYMESSLAVKHASGRAPYSRKLLKQAYKDVLAGKDPKASDGCLEETAKVLEQHRNTPVEKLTNNHLVRHRLLILERLLDDIVKKYADGDKNRIVQVTIESIRDLQEFSGLTAKQKAQLLGIKLSHHRKVAKKLEEALAEIGSNALVNASLIRKARIADDLNWICPFTGVELSVNDLINDRLQEAHIIPRSLRPSDSMESIVMTFREINAWQTNRTAWEFVSQEQGNSVPGKPNGAIMTLSRYESVVNKLKPHGPSKDDERRCKRRKKLLLTKTYEKQDREFTGRDLTITSFINKLAALQVKKYFQDSKQRIAPIHLPGSVTGAVRKRWKVTGCLNKACPLILDKAGEPKNKTEIREITHLHHALDAVVQGLASILIPDDGRLWELMSKNKHMPHERNIMEATGLFRFNAKGKWEMDDLSPSLKNQISDRLAEKRVIMHIPAKMDGLKVQQNTWGIKGLNDKDKIDLNQYGPRDSSKVRVKKPKEENPSKLLGYKPKNDNGKLKAIKGVLIIEENFGVALDPEPKVIPFFKVWTHLKEIKALNGNKFPRVLRKSEIINVPRGRYKGIWRVRSVKDAANGILLQLSSPESVPIQTGNILLKTLIKNGMQYIKTPYTGL